MQRGGELRGSIIRYAFVLLLALSISGSREGPLALQAPNPTGHYEETSGINLVCLEGDPYEMGLQQGTLVREPLRELVAGYLHQRIVLERGASYPGLLSYARLVESELPTGLRREIQGIADGAGLSYQDVLLLNLVPDLLALTHQRPSWDSYPPPFSTLGQSAAIPHFTMPRPKDGGSLACAAFAVWGHAAVDGGLLIGHNVDSEEADLLGRYQLVVTRHPSHGNTFVSVGLMGTVGVWTGMNEEKVIVTLSSSPSVDVAAKGQPLPFLLRRVLESAGDLGEAVHVLLGAHRLYGGNVLLGDGKAPAAIAVELSAHRHAVFEAAAEGEPLARTNHFLDPDLSLTQSDVLPERHRAVSEARLDSLQALLELNRGWIGADKGLTLLMDDLEAPFNAGGSSDRTIYGPDTLQSVLFYPERLTLWVAQGAVLRSLARASMTTPSRPYVSLALTTSLPECLGSRSTSPRDAALPDSSD
jgi:hypothetical protein